MKGIKIILISFLFVMQGSIVCAEAAEEAEEVEEVFDNLPTQVTTTIFANLPKQVTLVCDDGRLRNVSVRDLYEKFGFFEDLFNNWNDSSSSEIRMPSPCSVQDLKKILASQEVSGYEVATGVPNATSGKSYFELAQILDLKYERVALEDLAAVAKQDSPERSPEPSGVEKLPDLITLQCSDGTISDVSVALLMENFSFFDTSLRNWGVGRFGYVGRAVRVEGTVQAMRYLLCLISSCMWLESEPSALEVLQLADYVGLKKEQIDLLKSYYGDRLKDELVTPDAYERYLKGGRSDFLSAASLGKEYLPFSRFGESTVGISNDNIFYAISPNGNYGIRRMSKSLSVYDLSSETAQFLFTIPLETEKDNGVTFNHGDTVACVMQEVPGRGGIMQLWDLVSERLLKEMLLPRGDSLVFSPNDQWIATEQGEVWNTALGESYEIPSHHPDSQVRNDKGAVLAFSPDNQFLAFRPSGNTLGLFDLTSKTVFYLGRPSRAGEEIINISFSPDAKKVAVLMDPRRLRKIHKVEVYDVERKQLDFETSNVQKFFFTADAATLLLAERNPRRVGFCDMKTGEECMFDRNSTGIRGIESISPTGGDFILLGNVTGSDALDYPTREFFIVHLKDKQHPILLGDGKALGKFTFNKQGTLIAGLMAPCKVGVFDLAGELLWSLDLGGTLFSSRGTVMERLQFSADGRYLLAKCSHCDPNKDDRGFFKIPLPLAQIKKQELLKNSSEEARYLYHALTARVKAVGRKLDRLSLPEELKELFDDLPQDLKNEILTEEGQLKRAAERGLREAS